MKIILTTLALLFVSASALAFPRFEVPGCNHPDYQEPYEVQRNRSNGIIMDKRQMPVVQESDANEISRDPSKGRSTCFSVIRLSTADGTKSKMYTHEFTIEWVNDDINTHDVKITSLRSAPLHY